MAKHVKLFEEYNEENDGHPGFYENKEEIHNWLMAHDEYYYKGATRYTINNDGFVDVDGDVKLDTLDYIRVQFRNINGHFAGINNKLKSLKGSPEYITKSVVFMYTEIVSLKWAPKKIDGSFICCHNTNLLILQHSPEYIWGYFNCEDNPNLITLGHKSKIKGRFEHDDLHGTLSARWNRYRKYLDTLDESDKKSSLHWLYDVDKDFHKYIAEYVIENDIELSGINKDIASNALKHKDSGLF